jgi:hypothetical protein|tara:strand:- start:748 stop:1239 length:492 start_codon:yes stop_codon:yes gene_type:complete
MSSILRVDSIQTSSGGSATASSLGIGGVGKLGQVLQAEYGTAVTLNTSGFTDTGLSLAITPSATSSKILVSVVQSIYLDGGGAGITLRILRDSTSVFTQPVNYARYHGSASNERIFYPIQYLDSPSSTSAITYKTQGVGAFGSGHKVQHDSIKSTITLMEVLA